MRNTSIVGEASRWQIIAALTRRGKRLLLPVGDHLRYDLAIDEEGTFLRVQCKTGRLIDGVVRFLTCSIDSRNKKGVTIRRSYRGEIEFSGCIAQIMASVIWCRWKRSGQIKASFASYPRGIARRLAFTGQKIMRLSSEWSWRGSNPRPSECHSDALPAAPHPQRRSARHR